MTSVSSADPPLPRRSPRRDTLDELAGHELRAIAGEHPAICWSSTRRGHQAPRPQACHPGALTAARVAGLP